MLNSYNSDFLKMRKIGEPQISLTGKLYENEIWLEGAEVAKSAYPLLYLAYGDTYGTAENDNNFVLPDFRGRVIQGADGFGYLEAGLPNITGKVYNFASWQSSSVSIIMDGCFNQNNSPTEKIGLGGSTSSVDHKDGFCMDASASNSIYGSSDTVQPPAIKVRVKTMYKI